MIESNYLVVDEVAEIYCCCLKKRPISNNENKDLFFSLFNEGGKKKGINFVFPKTQEKLRWRNDFFVRSCQEPTFVKFELILFY